MSPSCTTPARIVVLVSGGGSNLQAIIDACRVDDFPARIVAVFSNKPEAYGLSRAQQAGIPTESLSHKAFASREAFDLALQERIDAYQPDLVVLAGFMRILTDGFVTHYLGRLINIHPSLLPKYAGLNTHQRAIDAGDAEAGASVHFVTPELDGGPVILQARVPVLAGDDANTLAARVLVEEHRLYPTVIRWFAEGRLALRGDIAWLDEQAIPATESTSH